MTPASVHRPRACLLDAAEGAEIALDPFAHHGLGRGPHVELRIEVAGHALHHDHGLLQHDELDAGRHVEERRDLEEKRQQLRHGDLVGAPVVDRLADGADRLREILHRMMRRHVAGLEMHLRHAQVIAADEAQKNFGEEAPLLHAEPAHDAEIDGDEPALRIHEQVAGMHVGVEIAVADGVAQEGLDHRAPERHPVEARRLDCRQIVEADAVDPGGGEHVAGGQVPFRLRHAEIRIVLGVLRQLRDGGGLEPQIHLDGDGAGQRLHDLQRLEAARIGHHALEQAGGGAHGLEIAGEALAHAGPHHLHRERSPRPRPCGCGPCGPARWRRRRSAR